MAIRLFSIDEQQFLRNNLFSTIHIISGKLPDWQLNRTDDDYDDDVYEGRWADARDKIVAEIDKAGEADRLRFQAVLAAGDKTSLLLQQEKTV